MLEFIPSLLWFFIVSFSLGFALTREKNLMSMGFGLAAFVLLAVAFNLIGIPLSWPVFVIISIALLGFFIHRGDLDFKAQKPDYILILVVLLFIVNTLIYWIGATSYPWLEDDDSWGYAHDAKWVAVKATSTIPYDGGFVGRGQRLEPFPPGYTILMGVLGQMTPSTSDTLKFYNAFIIGLGLVFAFYAFAQITGDRRLALFGAFFLLALPSFMNHFIWAQSLAVPLMFVAFYGYEKCLGDKRFVLPAAVAAASVALTHPAVALIFAIFSAAYFLVRAWNDGMEAAKTLAMMAVLAIGLSCIFYVPIVLKYGVQNTASGIGLTGSLVQVENGSITYVEDTSGNIVYSAQDFLFIEPFGKIDQQQGIGLVLMALSVLGLLAALNELRLGRKTSWLAYGAAWFAMGMIGVEGNLFPVKLFPHRFWVYLSIPIAMLAAYAFLKIEERFAKHKNILLVLLIASVFLTSAGPKLSVETSQWPPGVAFSSSDEIAGYVHIKDTLPKNTKIFPLCSYDGTVIGFDMLSGMYDDRAFKKTATNKTPDEVYSYLSRSGYSYMTIDVNCFKTLGQTTTNDLLNAYLQSGRFENTYVNGGLALFKLK